jgi:hypothetical protein
LNLHPPVRETRRQEEQVIHSEFVGGDDLLRFFDISTPVDHLNEMESKSQNRFVPGCVFFELPVAGFHQLWFCPDACRPFLPRDGGKRAIDNVAGGNGDDVRGNRYRLQRDVIGEYIYEKEFNNEPAYRYTRRFLPLHVFLRE